MNKSIRITHFASHLPSSTIDNFGILSSMNSDVSESVLSRAVGAKEKRVASVMEMGSDLMQIVGMRLLGDSNLQPHQISMLICSCDPVDQAAPDASVVTQHKLGLSCPSFGVSMSCVGWICGIRIASNLLKSGDDAAMVLSSSTVGSKFKFNSPMHRAIFGDGAGGALVSSAGGEGARILAVDLFTIGRHYRDIYAPMRWSAVPDSIPEGFRDSFFMNHDNTVFFKALDEHVKPFFMKVLSDAGVSMGEIDRFIVHQASMPIFNHTIKSFGIPREKAPDHYASYGNTISAELPIYIDLDIKSGYIKRGSKVVLFTYGAGFTAGVMVLQF